MRKITYTLFFALSLFLKTASAQLTDGSIAPDFTFVDMKGVTQNLYTYLNQGKYVALDISATWCGPCWEYHTKIKTMDDLYMKHDTPGDKKWKVLFVEGDEKTSNADMNGAGTNTKGNWMQNTHFSMMNPPAGAALASFIKNYKVGFFPTLYLICPNKKVFSKILNDPNLDWPRAADWEKIAKGCGQVTGIEDVETGNPIIVYPNPATNHVNVYVDLSYTTSIKLQVVNSIGQTVDLKSLDKEAIMNQPIIYSTSGLEPGIYFFIFNSADNQTITKKIMIQ